MRALLALILSTLQSQAHHLVKYDGIEGEAKFVVQEWGQPAEPEEVEAEDREVGVWQAKEQMFSDKMTYIKLWIWYLKVFQVNWYL